MFHVKHSFSTNQKVVGSNPAGRAKKTLDFQGFFVIHESKRHGNLWSFMVI